MSKKRTRNFEEAIGTAMDACIEKMADRLQISFDPGDKESLKLFRQFCSALNARRQWRKSLNQAADSMQYSLQQAQRAAARFASPGNLKPTLAESMLNKLHLNNPLRQKDRQNGFVMKQE